MISPHFTDWETEAGVGHALIFPEPERGGGEPGDCLVRGLQPCYLGSWQHGPEDSRGCCVAGFPVSLTSGTLLTQRREGDN